MDGLLWLEDGVVTGLRPYRLLSDVEPFLTLHKFKFGSFYLKICLLHLQTQHISLKVLLDLPAVPILSYLSLLPQPDYQLAGLLLLLFLDVALVQSL